MARIKTCLAICLALMLVFSPVSIGWAEGPNGGTTAGPTEGGDGHPWDDGTLEESQPGDDHGDDVDAVEPGTESALPVSTVRRGFGGWLEATITMIWRKIADTRITQDAGSKTSPKRRVSRRAH